MVIQQVVRDPELTGPLCNDTIERTYVCGCFQALIGDLNHRDRQLFVKSVFCITELPGSADFRRITRA